MPPPLGTNAADSAYWVLVCNPKKWAIDQFLEKRIERDTWGIRPSDRRRFAPGQLALVRVGVDRRSRADRDNKPKLIAGIYGLCEIESTAFEGTGANDAFWAADSGRPRGWPTVRIRYLRAYSDKPLSIEEIRIRRPGVSPLLLNGFQAASFPISAGDFEAVLTLLGEDIAELPASPGEPDVTADLLGEIERRYLHACPLVKQRISRRIERGSVGNLVKRLNGYRCQICEAVGMTPHGFKKENGEPYVEAHHVMPVSKQQIGSLAASNIMTVCANHHRQMHYGVVEVEIADRYFGLSIDGRPLQIPRMRIQGDVGRPNQ